MQPKFFEFLCEVRGQKKNLGKICAIYMFSVNNSVLDLWQQYCGAQQDIIHCQHTLGATYVKTHKFTTHYITSRPYLCESFQNAFCIGFSTYTSTYIFLMIFNFNIVRHFKSESVKGLIILQTLTSDCQSADDVPSLPLC
jgi:hypothetical protein